MKNFPLFVAIRYLISKKSRNVINIITGISIGGIAIGSMALIVILSAFNGLESLVESLYSSFDPDIKITATKGKTFEETAFPFNEVLAIDGVQGGTKVLEETVVLKYNQKQTFATIKGVDSNYVKLSRLDTMMFEGKLLLKKHNLNYAVLGYGIADKVGLYMENALQPIIVYAAKNTKRVSPNLADAFRVEPILPAGIFAINPDFDNKYALVPINFAERVLDKKGEISAFEIRLNTSVKPKEVKTKLESLLGNDFTVKTKYELNELIYQTNKTEKWITFLILSFVLVVATFNLVGNLAMLIIDKREDLFTLKSLGAEEKTVFQIFLIEGVLISMVGGIGGILIGAVLTLLQQHVGLVPLQGVIVEYYPMQIEAFDFIVVFFTVFIIGLSAAYLPAKLLTKRYFSNLTREI